MPILIDTNLLLRSIQPSHPMHTSAVRAIELLVEQVREEVSKLEGFFEVLHET